MFLDPLKYAYYLINKPKFIDNLIETIYTAKDKIIAFYQSNRYQSWKKQDNSMVTEADLASQTVFESFFAQTTPDIPLVSEENKIAPQDTSLYWLLDPMDGTRGFIKRNNQFVISLALIANHTPILGFISHPTTNQLWYGGPDISLTHIGHSPYHHTQTNWTHPNLFLNHKTPLYETYTHFNSVSILSSAYRYAMMTLAPCPLYFGRTINYTWDLAAGHALMRAIGGNVYNLETNTKICYEKPRKKIINFMCIGTSDPSIVHTWRIFAQKFTLHTL